MIWHIHITPIKLERLTDFADGADGAVGERAVVPLPRAVVGGVHCHVGAVEAPEPDEPVLQNRILRGVGFCVPHRIPDNAPPRPPCAATRTPLAPPAPAPASIRSASGSDITGGRSSAATACPSRAWSAPPTPTISMPA